MFTQSEFIRIQEELRIRQNTRRKKLKKIWGILLLIVLLVCGILIAIFPNQFSYGETVWIMPVYGGMAFITTLIGFLVSINYQSEKPFYEFLYPEIIQKVNMHEGLFLETESYVKEKQLFNKNGGLFTSYASLNNRIIIKGNTEDQIPFEIFDTTLTTSNGKSQQVHFDGLYIVLRKQLNTSIQIRHNGSPKKKGVKYNRLSDYENYRVYKKEEESIQIIDSTLIRNYETLQSNPTYKKIYLGTTEDEVHLAIVYMKHPLRKQKGLTLEKLNYLARFILDEMTLLNNLGKIDYY